MTAAAVASKLNRILPKLSSAVPVCSTIKIINGRNISSDSCIYNKGMSDFEIGKKAAAERAIEDHVKSGDLVGIGSGSTIVYGVKRLADLVKNGALKDIKCVPTSFQAKQLILENNLTLTSLESDPRLNIAIDGADEADNDLTLIKGGGGCLAQEKVVAENADLFVVIADDRKKSTQLGTSWKYVPIEVLDLAYKPVQKNIEAQLGGQAVLRMAKAKAGPVVTDNGNLLLDWTFDLRELRQRLSVTPDQDLWKAVNATLLGMAGVVDTGLFVNIAKVAYFGNAEGNVIQGGRKVRYRLSELLK